MYGRDWKSSAAERLHRLGLSGHARELYGLNKAQAEHEKRMAEKAAKPRPKTLLGRLRALLLP